MSHISEITKKAALAFEQYAFTTPLQRAHFLETIATNIEALGDSLLEQANKETNLPLPRLTGERGRTCFQLRMFATMLKEGNYVEASIDTAIPTKTPPKPDIRKMMHPIGPVVVFGASNFPFAYSTAGGDTASALAVGCSVIVKAHPAHLATSNIVAEAIVQAAKATQMPENVFQHVTDTSFETCKALVQDDNIYAVGFTGSRTGGRALLDYASTRKNPIAVFAEMGSVNPVLLLEDALVKNAETIAKNYAGSITLGMGQFCTNPGILIGIKSEALNTFANTLATEMNAIAPSAMLHAGIEAAYLKNSAHALAQKGLTCLTNNTPISNNGYPVLTTVNADTFLSNPDLAEEVFGPYSILLLNMSLSIAGRVLLNGVPTGVEVCDSMVHGGPYPASTDSRFTAVGVNAAKRWLRPISFQNWSNHLLPMALQNNNPLGIWRNINGGLTKDEVVG